MVWVSAVLVGFPALTALVIALGRGTTARWEQEEARPPHDPPAALRGGGPAVPEPPAGHSTVR